MKGPGPTRCVGAQSGFGDTILQRAVSHSVIAPMAVIVMGVSGSGKSTILRMIAGLAGIDLLLTDVIMPGMNGVELAGIIRDRFPGLPVVLTSGYSNVLAENAHSGFELIQKPYSVEALSRTLRKAIAEQRAIATKP